MCSDERKHESRRVQVCMVKVNIGRGDRRQTIFKGSRLKAVFRCMHMSVDIYWSALVQKLEVTRNGDPGSRLLNVNGWRSQVRLVPVLVLMDICRCTTRECSNFSPSLACHGALRHFAATERPHHDDSHSQAVVCLMAFGLGVDIRRPARPK